MKQLLITITTMLTLIGCTTPNGLNATAASTTATVIGTVVAGPVVGVAAGGAAGVAADLLTPNTTETKLEVIETIPEDQRASVLKWESFWMSIEHLGLWLIGTFVFLWIVPSPRAIWKGMK